jgi:hypothetical protein
MISTSVSESFVAVIELDPVCPKARDETDKPTAAPASVFKKSRRSVDAVTIVV